MNIRNRLEKLEKAARPDTEMTVYITEFASKENEGTRQRVEADIARQRGEGKTHIVVKVPFGYEMQES